MRTEDAVIIQTADSRDLAAITNPLVQAVIFAPPMLPDWFAGVTAAVESGTLSVPRTVLPNASRNQIDDWLDVNLPGNGLVPGIRTALKNDVLGLVDRFGELSQASRFMLRIFTDVPTTECGFHVDTVPPGAHGWGLLRVYNGAGTEYVEPSNVRSVGEFYRYLSRRERLVRERRDARNNQESELDRLDQAIAALDAERAFLVRPEDIASAPAGTIVAFKHIDVRYHWSDHVKVMAWIHCSPMVGGPRLVVNLTAPEPAPRSLRRATSVTAR